MRQRVPERESGLTRRPHEAAVGRRVRATIELSCGAAAFFVGAFLLFCVGVWISIVRRGWMDGRRERRPTLREELPPD